MHFEGDGQPICSSNTWKAFELKSLINSFHSFNENGFCCFIVGYSSWGKFGSFKAINSLGVDVILIDQRRST